MKAILSTLLLLCFGGKLMTCAALHSPLLTPKTQVHAASASSADNYSIVFSRNGSEDFNLHVVYTFTLRFANADSVTMQFGGNPEISVSGLEVRTVPATAWNPSPDRHAPQRQQCSGLRERPRPHRKGRQGDGIRKMDRLHAALLHNIPLPSTHLRRIIGLLAEEDATTANKLDSLVRHF